LSYKALFGLALLSAATLAFEINLTRLFSVAQFYHFAFLIVSMALLGFGASGAFLAIQPRFGSENPDRTLGWLALGCGAGMLGSYLLTNWLPFDSFRIAWDPSQVAVLAAHYLALATPFFFSGLATGLLLATAPERAGTTYAANLAGSALGCGIALIAPAALGGEGLVTLSCGLACLSVPIFCPPADGAGKRKPALILNLAACLLLLLVLFDLGSRLVRERSPAWMELQISPYKGLSYALQYPDAAVIFRRWNAISRIDLVRSSGVRSLPGLSYRYTKPPPAEDGLLVDADEISAVLRPGYAPDFYDYLPGAVAFRLRPGERALILEPRGGLDALSAIELGASQVTAVEPNPLVVEAAGDIYRQAQITTVVESGRSYLRRTRNQYDVIVLSLTNNFHPVRSGAYSLAEDYRYTVESFEDALARLAPGGVLVVTRWLQNPPSESLRTFALAVEAVERRGGDPAAQIAALRGYNTATLLVKNEAFEDHQVDTVREWAASRAFDLVHAPGMRPEEANQYNVLPEPLYYQAFKDLLAAQPRQAFYDGYPFEVAPPSDDRPFFGHYFKWSQSRQIMAEFGKTWQPFGGAGYFVVLALLILAVVMASLVILLPVAATRVRRHRRGPSPEADDNRRGSTYLVYFALIGFGFLLAEIPLIQRFILFLGYPAYAMTAVLFTVLLFSGLGSQLSARLPLRGVLGMLALLLLVGPALLPAIFQAALGAPLWARLGLTILLLAPLGTLMGVPFAGGIRWTLESGGRGTLVPWIWAINGAASVVASVLAALLALSFGFSRVLWIGALCYAGCWLMVTVTRRSRSPHP
jgi:hypothetical protein